MAGGLTLKLSSNWFLLEEKDSRGGRHTWKAGGLYPQFLSVYKCVIATLAAEKAKGYQEKFEPKK